MIGVRHLAAELRRRKVFRTAGLYLIGAWIALQVANVTFAPLGVPDWVNTLLIWAAIIGFPVTVLLGWRYEIGPEGLVRTRPRTVADERLDLSLRSSDYVILLLLVIVIGAAAYGMVARYAATSAGDSGALITQNTLAVLPFVDASTDESARREGLSDEVRDQLSQVDGLRVIARASSLVFRDQAVDLRTVSSELGAAFLLAARLDAGVVEVELIEGQSGTRLWAHVFDRRAQSLPAVQQEIVSQVVASIVPGAAVAPPATSNVSAAELLLTARGLDEQVRGQLLVDEAKLERAIELYRAAIELDPQSAVAHSRLGALLLYAGHVDAANLEVFQALTLDRNLSEAHYTQALYFLRAGLPGIEAAYRRAIELNPNNTEALSAYGLWLRAHGEIASVRRYLESALELDPQSLVRHQDLAEYLGDTNQKEAALEIAAKIETRFPGARGYLALARAYELIGELDVGIAWALRALELQPDDSDIAGQVAELYARISDFESARIYEPEPGIGQLFWQRRYPELISLGEELSLEPQGADFWHLLGFAYNATGAFEQSALMLEGIGLEQRSNESRTASEGQAIGVLNQARLALGDTMGPREWAAAMIVVASRRWGADLDFGKSWYGSVYQACSLAMLERDAEAVDELERINESVGLVWMPLLQDSYCFRRLQNEPRYLSVVAHAALRHQQLRERLPETLRAHGVAMASN